IAPTYKMAKNVAWDLLKEYSKFMPHITLKESELSVTYPNDSRITLYGAENPDSLRGMGLSGVVFDEYGMQPSNIFTEIIRPTLLEKEGYAIWIGTPKGKNEFYQLYERHKHDEDWFVRHLTVNDTDAISKAEIENARKDMSQEEIYQELYCSFESAVKGAVYADELRRAREQGRVGVLPIQREYLVHTVWDIGVGQAMAIGFYQRIAGRMHMIDYWQGTESEGIDHAVHAVQEKLYNYGNHFAPHDIRAREISTGISRLDYARDLGLSFSIISPRGNVDDGIQSGRFMFDKLWVDEEKCSRWLDAISQYRRQWNDDRGMFQKIPYLDWTSHGADVHRYAAIIENDMKEKTNSYADRAFQEWNSRALQEEWDALDPYN
ncbi:MAG: terminase family protein, partial [bacterium]|nr:terminase family protein [bacterium]